MSGNTAVKEKPVPVEPESATPPSRDDIRAAIFGAKPDSQDITFFGKTIELRQPNLGVIMDMRRGAIEDAMVQMLMNYAYVPGTNDKVFEEADEDGIRGIPFGPDMQRLLNAVNSLVGIDQEGLDARVEEAEKSPAK